MSDSTNGSDASRPEVPADGDAAGRSVLEHLQGRLGEAPRIALRDEDTAGASAPLIDPRSDERRALPRGRGTYQLMGEIARGGMGVVIKGHDTDLGRDVAMKVLDKRLAQRPEVVQRFVEEAQIGGQLQHPGIVPVYELGLMADERPYFTMKLVKGRTLANLLVERASPDADRCRLVDVFESVCQTMAYAHSRGVIHRDLKPANIMVGAFGEVQVVDWGLAKVMARGGKADEKRAREAQSHLTVLETVRSEGTGSGSDSMVGSVMGTPAYMPPEQASGLVDRLDERSDVFSLGAILCEILTGKPPYVGDRGEVIAQAAQAEYDEALARLDACGADEELVKLVQQCLKAAPAARPANAGVVAERVHAWVVGAEARAHAARVSAAEARVRADEERKARRLTLALGASVVVMLLLGGGGWVWVREERADRDRATAARLQEATERARELTAEVDQVLSEASRLEGQERWGDAIVSAERARGLAEGGDAGPELVARVDAVLADLRRGEERARALAERARDTERLRAELLELRVPDWDDEGVPRPYPELDASQAYARTFESHGLVLDDGDPMAVADELTARGLGSELALVLDHWADLRRRAQHDRGAQRLLELAHRIDPDPLRADLREAVVDGRLDVLQWIVESGFDDQPALTIGLLGSALVQLGDRATALRVLRVGTQRHPQDFSLQYELGRLLTPDEGDPGFDKREEMREGVECYRAALALRPDSLLARYYLARLYFKLDEFERALAHYRIGRERRPEDPAFAFHLGASWRHQGDLDRATEHYALALELAGGGSASSWVVPWSNHGLGQVLVQRGDLEGALEHFRIAVGHDPVDAVLQNALVRTLLDTGRLEEAEQAILEAERLIPESANLRNNLAWTLANAPGSSSQDLVRAVAYAERAVELAPNDANCWNTLGYARLRAGDLERAVEALERAMTLAGGGHVFDWLFMAVALHRLGNERDAHVWYGRAVHWMELNDSLEVGEAEELARFRAEADAYLAD